MNIIGEQICIDNADKLSQYENSLVNTRSPLEYIVQMIITYSFIRTQNGVFVFLHKFWHLLEELYFCHETPEQVS